MGPHMSKTPRMPWFQCALEAAEPGLRKAALRAKDRLTSVRGIYVKVVESAQLHNRADAIDIDRAELALLDQVDEAAIDRIMLAFEAPDVGLIVDGRLTHFVPRALSPSQRYRIAEKEREAAKRAAQAEASALARDAQTVNCEPPATREAASASRFAAESKKSSLRDVDIENSRIVISRPDASAREDAATMTDDELINAIEATCPQKITQRVAKQGLPVVRKWLADGFDLRLDIEPVLSRKVPKLRGKLGNLGASFLIDELVEHRQWRLSRGSDPPAAKASFQPVKPQSAANVFARVLNGNTTINGDDVTTQ
jgi:hypothetical protein